MAAPPPVPGLPAPPPPSPVPGGGPSVGPGVGPPVSGGVVGGAAGVVVIGGGVGLRVTGALVGVVVRNVGRGAVPFGRVVPRVGLSVTGLSVVSSPGVAVVVAPVTGTGVPPVGSFLPLPSQMASPRPAAVRNNTTMAATTIFWLRGIPVPAAVAGGGRGRAGTGLSWVVRAARVVIVVPVMDVPVIVRQSIGRVAASAAAPSSAALANRSAGCL